MKKFFAVVLSALCIMPMAGCFADDTSGKTVEVVDALERTIEVPETVEKVVCIGAGALRLYSYVGDMDKVVAVEDVDKDGTGIGGNLSFRPYKMVNATKLNALPSCGKGGPNSSADAELILTLKPDLIISGYNSNGAADELQNATGIPVLNIAYGSDKPFDKKTKDSITAIGKAMNRVERSTAVVNKIEEVYDELNDATKDIQTSDKATVYLGCNSFYGTNGFATSSGNYAIFKASNIRNVLTENGVTANNLTIDLEAQLKVFDPDVVILDAGGVAKMKTEYQESQNATIYNSLKAFRNGEVYLQMPFNAYETNLEIALADAYFAAKVAYPTVFASLDVVAKTRELITFFNGADCYDQIATKMYGGFQKVNLAEMFPEYSNV